MKIEWNPSWDTGIAIIDEQHHEWFTQVNGMLTALNADEPFNIELLMAYFKDYADMHFDTEEILMRDLGYPRMGQHTQAHNALRVRLDQVQGTTEVTPELLYLLAEWLIVHIGKEDFALAIFLKKQ